MSVDRHPCFSRTPLRVLAVLVTMIVILKLYGGIISTIDSVPLASGLLELVGLIWVLNFARSNLIRSSDRQQTADDLRSRWKTITGR